MKTKQCIIILILITGTGVLNAHAQWDNMGNRIGNSLNNKAQQKIEQEIDNAAEKSYNKTKEGVKNDVKSNKSNSGNTSSGKNNNDGSSSQNSGSSGTGALSATSKFDFVAGDKVIAIEDFAQDEIGDFPAKWNTNSSGEIVTLNGKPGKWLQLSDKGSFLPEFFNQLPENFTFEFDLACSQPFSYYSTDLNVSFVQMAKPATDFMKWSKFKHGENGVSVSFHPQDAGNTPVGQTGYITYQANAKVMENKISTKLFSTKSKPVVHISVWRQKGRLRVYIDQEKVWDLPKAFSAPKYNGIVFWIYSYSPDTDRYYISNLKLSVGAPDTRSKLITEGKFSTSGILFDVNSDKMKSESHGVIKSIADVLTENPDVNIRVIGHTDSDGDDAKNLELSKKRAVSVKNYLTKVFNINAGRIETDGKGETQPVDKNTTTEGKANNRRVEFVKL